MALTHSINRCGHSFCYECISDWLKKSQTCPLCQSTIEGLIPCHLVDDLVRVSLNGVSEELVSLDERVKRGLNSKNGGIKATSSGKMEASMALTRVGRRTAANSQRIRKASTASAAPIHINDSPVKVYVTSPTKKRQATLSFSTQQHLPSKVPFGVKSGAAGGSIQCIDLTDDSTDTSSHSFVHSDAPRCKLDSHSDSLPVLFRC